MSFIYHGLNQQYHKCMHTVHRHDMIIIRNCVHMKTTKRAMFNNRSPWKRVLKERQLTQQYRNTCNNKNVHIYIQNK